MATSATNNGGSKGGRGMAIFNQLTAIILPVLICAGLGFTWARMRQPSTTTSSPGSSR